MAPDGPRPGPPAPTLYYFQCLTCGSVCFLDWQWMDLSWLQNPRTPQVSILHPPVLQEGRREIGRSGASARVSESRRRREGPRPPRRSLDPTRTAPGPPPRTPQQVSILQFCRKDAEKLGGAAQVSGPPRLQTRTRTPSILPPDPHQPTPGPPSAHPRTPQSPPDPYQTTPSLPPDPHQPTPGPPSLPRTPIRPPPASPRTPQSPPDPYQPTPGPPGPPMTTAEAAQSAPLLLRGSVRGSCYRGLCFVLLVLQGGLLDLALVLSTDLSWCCWAVTDLAVIAGWAVFFLKNARSKRERACGFRQSSSVFGCALGEFTHAYLAWLVYVIAYTPRLLLIVETPILQTLAARVPGGMTAFKVNALLCAPLLFCLVNSVLVDLNGPTRLHAHGCFVSTCVDVLDSFTLLEPLLAGDVHADGPALRYTVLGAYVAALLVPVAWLHELTASELRCTGLCARFCAGVLVDAPALAVRVVQVWVHGAPVSAFLLKNVFFLLVRAVELLERSAVLRAARRPPGPAHFSRGVSENDMCPHGYVNTLAVAQA
ncbi:transmembrane protein 121B [Cololabis saira]|uniref:transmembrane protein 121B n=1 Tax=Cololabis saira TaxID=129043 RepID=UPI002AD4C9AB|nr:transmembrane protein 121B [Cololabis saira]